MLDRHDLLTSVREWLPGLAAGIAREESGLDAAGLTIELRRRAVHRLFESRVKAESLGHVYEWLLTRSVSLSRDRTITIVDDQRGRKSGGAYYTPDEVVQYVVERTLTPLKQQTTVRVLDPACGGGAFLLGAFRSLVSSGRDPVRLLRESLFGVDLDGLAVEVCRLSLQLALLELDPTAELPPLKLKRGNSLLGPDFESPNAFDWHAEFPAAMHDGGFDAVIGNPPYLSYAGRQRAPLDDAEREHLSPRLAHSGWLTSHGLFVERSVRTLSRRFVGLVVPDQVGHLAGYAAVRAIVNPSLTEVRYWGEKLFADAVTPALTLIADREHSGPAQILAAGRAPRDVLLAGSDPWSPSPASGLVARLTAETGRLGSLVADPGVHTGNCGEQLILRAEATESSVPILEGRQVQRYACGPPTKSLRIGYQPRGAEYFTVRPRQKYTDAPFVIRQTAAYPIVGPRRHADYFRNSLLALYPPADATDIRYLVALLNSRLLRYAYRSLIQESGQRTFPQVKIRSLRALPIKWPDLTRARERQQHDDIVRLVRKLELAAAASSQAEFATLDGALDATVYELYGLSDEEVAEVETASVR